MLALTKARNAILNGVITRTRALHLYKEGVYGPIVPLEELSKSKLKDLGFKRMRNQIWLAPYWIVPFLPHGRYYFVNGNAFDYRTKDDLPKERGLFGCYAQFGVKRDVERVLPTKPQPQESTMSRLVRKFKTGWLQGIMGRRRNTRDAKG